MRAAIQYMGLAQPFLLAGAVFGLFNYLERIASPPARKALSAWLLDAPYSQNNVAKLMVDTFDGIYTSPLYGWRAMLRSAVISISVTLILTYSAYQAIFTIAAFSPEMRRQWTTQILANIIADDVSLFFIRRWLIFGGSRPLLALLTGPLVGFAVIAVVYAIRDVGGFSIATGTFHFRYFYEDVLEWIRFITTPGGTNRFLALLALVVHLWQPLFAIAVLLAQVINYMRKLTGRVQWFIKYGQRLPFRAIGFLAMIVTFLVSLVWLLRADLLLPAVG